MRARVRGAVAAAVLAATLASAVPTSAAPTDVAPFSSIDAFVKQQYRDFTGREPFALELSSSRAPLEAGTSTPAEAVDEISHRDDGSVRTCNVTRLYTAYFLRLPDISGENYWVGKVRNGMTLIRISNQFAGSSEFKRRYGSLTNAQFVDLVYRNVFDRAADPSGRAYWIGKLNRGMSRGQVMATYSTSNEYVRKQAVRCDVVLAYFGLLRRMPTAVQAASAEELVAAEGFVALAAELMEQEAWSARFPAPGVPANVTVSTDDKQATVRWGAAPTNGTPLTGYIVRPFVNGVAQADRAAGASATSLKVTGLSNGTTYTFGVFAKNATTIGPMAVSSAALVKPQVVWSTFQGNAQHTGVRPHGTVPQTPTFAWEYDFGGEESPKEVVVGGGRVFALLPGSNAAGAGGLRVFALDEATGAKVWGPVVTGGSYQDGYLGYEDGRVFIENDDGLIKAVDAATGSLLWSRNLGDHVWDQKGLTVYDGVLYTFQYEGLTAIDSSNGAIKWVKSFGNDSGTPGVDASGIYVTQVCNDNARFSFTGQIVWSTSGACTGGGAGTAALHSNRVWADGDWSAGTFSILDQANGNLVGDFEVEAPALSGSMAVYVSSGTVEAYEWATGVQRWTQAGDGNLAGPAVINAGRVYVRSDRGRVYSFDLATGTQRWDHDVLADLVDDVPWYQADAQALAIGEGVLLVPAGGSLVAYR